MPVGTYNPTTSGSGTHSVDDAIENSPGWNEAKRRAQAAYLQAPGSIGTNAIKYADGSSASNATQTPLERIVESRKDYYLGGTANYANDAAARAQQTGNAYAETLSNNAGNLNARADAVFNRGYGPEGPSAAQATLRQGTNEALGTQLALARSGRGMGESSSAMNAAQGNAVGLQTAATNNAAILRAQETEAYAQRRDAAKRANDQAALGYSTLGQEGYGAAGGMALQGQGLENQIQTQALAGAEGYESNLTQQYGIHAGVSAQNAAAERQQQAAYMQMIASAAEAYGQSGSDERIKYNKHLLSPIEAKKDRQPLSSTGSFADPLAPSVAVPSVAVPSVGAFNNVPGQTIAPGALIHPQRHEPGTPLGYKAAPSSFAQELEASPNRGNPEAGSIINPWPAQSAAADPWQKYLMDRDRREQEEHEQTEKDKASSRAGATFASLGLIGYALAKSDERSKEGKRRVRGRLAQDPIINMPAVSQRGVIMSDEKSKTAIASLRTENERLTAANEWLSSNADPRALATAPSDADAVRIYQQGRRRDSRQATAETAAANKKKAPTKAPGQDVLRISAPIDWDEQRRSRDLAVSGPPTPQAQRGVGVNDALDMAETAGPWGEAPNPQREQTMLDYADFLATQRQAEMPEQPPVGPGLAGYQLPSAVYRAKQQTYTMPGRNMPNKLDILMQPPGYGTAPDRPPEVFQQPKAGTTESDAWDSGGFQASLSDERSKRDMSPLDAIRAAPGYSYKYKQPGALGAAPGTHYGPMAQDLEKTPMGASTVVESPDGVKMVDTGRLALVNTAALHAQQEELDALKQQLAAMRGGKRAA